MADSTTQTNPGITERFLLKQTAKGWRLDETSLAIDWNGQTPDLEFRRLLLRESYMAGMIEACARNDAEEPS